MIKCARYLLLAIWTILATFGLTFAWLEWVAPVFPYPEGFWFWIFTNVPGFWDGEAGDDLVILIHAIPSLVAVLTLNRLVGKLFRARR